MPEVCLDQVMSAAAEASEEQFELDWNEFERQMTEE